MKTTWTKGLDAKDQDELKGDFLSSRLVRHRLKALLEDKINESVKGSRNKDSYESPSWAYLQADARGYERALSEIISLISD